MPAFVDRKFRRHRQRRGGQESLGMADEPPAGMTCETLRSYVESELRSRMLLLDCRPFLAYNASHIAGAVNVHCPAILRRRAGGRLPLRTLVPNAELRDRLLQGGFSPLVLYDDDDQRRDDSMVTFVARCLQQEAAITSIHILEGGFHQFRSSYPHLCTTASLKTVPKSGVPRAGGSTPRTPKPSWSSGHPQACPSHEQEEPVEILPYLYLGSEYHASCKSKLQRLGITALLNVSQTCPNHFEECFTYKSIPVQDSGSEDIGVWFAEAIQFIDGVKSSAGKVLVHCHAGISRSATICMAYLMATKRLRMEEAYEFVKSRRRIVSPNFNFMGQLLSFESQVFSAPRSPLAAIVARTPASAGGPHPSSPSDLPPTTTVFDFKLPYGFDLPCAAAQLASSPVVGPLLSPLCLTPRIVSPS